MSTYRIQSHKGTGLFLNVYGTGTITGRRNVCIWTETTSNDQKWSITSLGNKVLVKSMNNQNYALNAKTDTWNCDVMTVNTDSYVNFKVVNSSTGLYKIQLVSNNERYLTADGTAKNSNVSWATLDSSSDAQIWKVTKVDTTSTGGEKKLKMPVGPRCNWNQKNKAVTDLFGSSACTLVCGLDTSNFYATNGTGYTPQDMNSSKFWVSGVGYTWATLAGKILGKITADSKSQNELLALIKDTIDGGCPCIVTIGYKSGSTHTVFAYGYKNGAASYADIYVYDPANMTTSDIGGREVDLNNAMDYNHDYFNIFYIRPTAKS